MLQIERGSDRFDTNNWLRKLEAMLSHDIYAGRGSIEETAKRIRARLLIIVARQDHMVAPEESLKLAKVLGVDPVVLTSNCGHTANSCEEEKFRDRVRKLLAPAAESPRAVGRGF
jgi:homoserine O-acetyltransferase